MTSSRVLVALATAALHLAPVARAQQPATAPPLFPQYRFDGSHSGRAVGAALGPGRAAAPTTVTRSFVGGGGGVAGQPVVASDGTALFLDSGGTLWAARPGAAAPLWSFATAASPFGAWAAPAISPDGSIVVVLGGSTVFLLNATNGALIYSKDTFYTLGKPPTILLDGSQVVVTANYFYVLSLSPPFVSTSYGYAVASAVTADSDLLLGQCLIYVLPEAKVEKRCLGGPGGSGVAWQVQLSEISTLTPIVGDGVVYVVTSASGFVYAIDSATGAAICNSSALPLSAVTTEIAYVGGKYGIAFPVEGAGVVYVTQSGADACSGAAVLPLPFAGGGGFSVGPIIVDAEGSGYMTVYAAAVGVPLVVAIDFTVTPQPVITWNFTMTDAVTPLISEPAIGADRALLFTRISPAGGALVEVLALYPPPAVCPPGEYSQLNATCAPCPAGTYSGPVNATAPTVACSPCPAGSSSSPGSSFAAACTACAAGFFSAGAGGTCLPCAAGSYGPAANASSCALCPAGTASAAVNATRAATCSGCAPGSAQPLAGQSSCVACAAGSYAAAANATACAAAPPACYTPAGSAAACAADIVYAQFAFDATHCSQSQLPGPGPAPSVVALPIFSGQPSLPLSGLAVGPTGGVVQGRPSDGLVYVGLTDDIFAVSPANGAIVFNYNAPAGVSFGGSPAVAPWGAVFVVSSSFTLVALHFDAAGDPLWTTRAPLASAGSPVSAPAVHSANRAVYFSAGASVVAVDGGNGTVLWSWPGPLTYACSTTPALDAAGARVFVGCDDSSIYALDAHSGAQLWRHPMSAAVRAPLAVSADGALVFAASDSNNLVALDAATGAPAWLPVAVSAAAVRAAPAVVEGLGVLVATRGGAVFLANGSAAGSVVWSTLLSNGSLIPPAATAVTLGSDGAAFVACEDGSLFSLDVATGSQHWRLGLGEPLFSPPVLVAGGAGGALLLPSLRSSALLVVRGLSASLTPSATATPTASASSSASASASATATASATGSSSASGSATATLSAFFTATSSASSPPSPSPSSSSNSTGGGGGGGAAASGLTSTSVIALSATVPLAVVALLLGAAFASGRVRIVRGGGAGGAAEEWGGARLRAAGGGKGTAGYGTATNNSLAAAAAV